MGKKANLEEMKGILTNASLSTGNQLKIWKNYMWSMILCGCEIWTVCIEMKNKLEAAEMWFIGIMIMCPVRGKKD